MLWKFLRIVFGKEKPKRPWTNPWTFPKGTSRWPELVAICLTLLKLSNSIDSREACYSWQGSNVLSCHVTQRGTHKISWLDIQLPSSGRNGRWRRDMEAGLSWGIFDAFSFLFGFGCGGTDRGNLQQVIHGTVLRSCPTPLWMSQPPKHDQSTTLEQSVLPCRSLDNVDYVVRSVDGR